MLSIVLYGRNDNYGYNLHKRAALSLNCMAEVLSDPDDEILFVDYNTPDDFPTFAEAIADTLTDKAKRYLRVLRVRPSVHARFAARTHLIALEPVARNVAVRRSNPANRWILSTNTDMIFVPRKERSLSEIVRDLSAGHYGIPRFEVPETLWEGLDRGAPQSVIDTISRWGWEFHLNEVVTGLSPFLFDAPGDFQLMQRADLFEIDGFNEDMLLGWHVDANIAKRLSFLHGNVHDLSERLFGYHCDHTRQVTPAHRSGAVQNSIDLFFSDVSQPDVPKQRDGWGCPDDQIEEVRISAPERGVYFQSLQSLYGSPLTVPGHSPYIPESYNSCGYSCEHVLPFLLDIFAAAPRHWQIAWIGAPGAMLHLFSEGWRRLGFTEPILAVKTQKGGLPEESAASFKLASFGEIAKHANAFIFDFSRGDGAVLNIGSEADDRTLARSLVNSFQTLVWAEQMSVNSGGSQRRFLGINAIHNQFETIFSDYVNCAKTPFSVRIRHGFLFKTEAAAKSLVGSALSKALPANPSSDIAVLERVIDAFIAATLTAAPSGSMEGRNEDWLARMAPAVAGARYRGAIVARVGVAGPVAYVAPLQLTPGRYQISLDLSFDGYNELELAGGIRSWLLSSAVGMRRRGGYKLERRLRRTGRRVLGLTLSSYLKARFKGYLTYGPSNGNGSAIPVIQIDILDGKNTVVSQRLLGDDIREPSHCYDIEVAPSGSNGRGILAMFVSSNGSIPFKIKSVHIQRQDSGSVQKVN